MTVSQRFSHLCEEPTGFHLREAAWPVNATSENTDLTFLSGFVIERCWKFITMEEIRLTS